MLERISSGNNVVPKYSIGDKVSVVLEIQSRDVFFEPNTEFIVKDINIKDNGGVEYLLEHDGKTIDIDESTLRIMSENEEDEEKLQQEENSQGSESSILSYVIMLIFLIAVIIVVIVKNM